MVRGLYTGYTGMVNEQKRLDIISNNITNSATVGYKKEGVTNQSFDDVLTLKIRDASVAYQDRVIGDMSLGVKIGEVYTDFNQGSLRETGNTYDLAIEGKGFFPVTVVDKEGNETTKYTRDGSFKRTADGFIVDTNGNHLKSENGDLVIPPDANDVSIGTDGSVFADNMLIDKIKITDFEDYAYLKKYGENMYEPVDGAVEMDGNSLIHQGFTEQSNINVVSEMVQMITITRAYEANQKVIQTVDTMLDHAVNSVGKV